MTMTIQDLQQKVENGGATATGRLTAEEWNTLVSYVLTLATMAGHDNVDASADGEAPEDMLLCKQGGSSTWTARPAHIVKDDIKRAFVTESQYAAITAAGIVDADTLYFIYE